MLPTFFLSHGSPMHALNAGAAGEAWQAMAAAITPPVAVLVVTAHWETLQPTLSAAAAPPMIYDFSGFPDALYKISYAAKGAPALAIRAQALLTAAHISAAQEPTRGFDHGTWVPLRKMFPDAAIPVVQLSVQPARDAEHHLAVGRALAPLTREGVLIVGSGHLTHNLGDWMRGAGRDGVPAYVREFQHWVWEALKQNDSGKLARYRELAPGAARAHPSPEHFLPLFVARGAAGEQPEVTRTYAGIEGNVLAMDAYRFG